MQLKVEIRNTKALKAKHKTLNESIRILYKMK